MLRIITYKVTSMQAFWKNGWFAVHQLQNNFIAIIIYPSEFSHFENTKFWHFECIHSPDGQKPSHLL